MSDDSTSVDVTDNLDDFETAFFGSAKQEEIVDEEQEVEGGEDTPDAEPEDEVDGPDAEEVEDEEGDEPEPEEPKRRKSAKERIQELANERREEREARIAAEARLKLLEEQLAKLDKPEPEKAPVKDVKATAPDPDATGEDGELTYPLGEFDPQYIADLTKHLFKQEAAAAKAEALREAEEARASETQNELEGAWEDKLAATEETLPDLREKLSVLEGTFGSIDPEYGAYLAETIMSMDRGPEVLYYLANNIDEAQKIVTSGARQATIALGRLEGLMSFEEPKKEEKRNDKKVSKAPVPPVQSRGTAVAKTASADTDDLEAFERDFFKRK